MNAFDLSTLGVVIATLTGIGSFFLGRRLSRRRTEKRMAKEREAAQANESRQVRRARERKGPR